MPPTPIPRYDQCFIVPALALFYFAYGAVYKRPLYYKGRCKERGGYFFFDLQLFVTWGGWFSTTIHIFLNVTKPSRQISWPERIDLLHTTVSYKSSQTLAIAAWISKTYLGSMFYRTSPPLHVTFSFTDLKKIAMRSTTTIHPLLCDINWPCAIWAPKYFSHFISNLDHKALTNVDPFNASNCPGRSTSCY